MRVRLSARGSIRRREKGECTAGTRARALFQGTQAQFPSNTHSTPRSSSAPPGGRPRRGPCQRRRRRGPWMKFFRERARPSRQLLQGMYALVCTGALRRPGWRGVGRCAGRAGTRAAEQKNAGSREPSGREMLLWERSHCCLLYFFSRPAPPHTDSPWPPPPPRRYVG